MIKRSQLPPDILTVDSGKGIVNVIVLYAKVALAVALAYFIESRLIDALCVILIGTLQYHFNILGHEGLHHLLHKKRRVNDILCRWFIEAPVAAPMSLLRKNHLNHHNYVGQERDNDRQYYEVERFRDRNIMALWLIGSLLGGMTLAVVYKLFALFLKSGTPTTADRAGRLTMNKEVLWDMLSIGLAQSILFAVFAVLFGWHGYFLYWLLPLLTIMMGLNVIRSCAEHVLVRNEHNTDRLFSFRPGWMEAFFLSPYNMNYHAEHHLIPTVPYYRLEQFATHLQSPDSKRKLADYPIEKSYLTKLRRVYRRWNDPSLSETSVINIG